MPNGPTIENPKPNWVELYRAPFEFRAEYDGAKYSPAIPLDELAGAYKNSEIATFSLDKKYAALIVHWEWPEGNGKTTPPAVGGGPTHEHLDLLRKAPPSTFIGKEIFFPENLPIELFDEAMKAIKDIVNLKLRFKEEFYSAIDDGMCEIFARRGKPDAVFSRIPAAVFRRYGITNWGGRDEAINLAQYPDMDNLYEIHAAPVKSNIGGRPGGSGSFAEADAPLIVEMHELIENGEAASPHNATLLVLDRATGNGTDDSKRSRLRRRYMAKYKN